MAKYEMLVMLNNESADETKEATLAKLEGIITSRGGAVVSTEILGKDCIVTVRGVGYRFETK